MNFIGHFEFGKNYKSYSFVKSEPNLKSFLSSSEVKYEVVLNSSEPKSKVHLTPLHASPAFSDSWSDFRSLKCAKIHLKGGGRGASPESIAVEIGPNSAVEKFYRRKLNCAAGHHDAYLSPIGINFQELSC